MEPAEVVEIGETVDEALVLGDGPVVVEAAVGQTLDTRLRWASGRAYRWTARGGPPGLHVRPDGTLAYDLGEDAAGRWWVEVRRVGTTKHVGFELRVQPEGGLLADDAPLRPPRRPYRGLPGGSCSLGLGVATGLVYLPASSWTHLGIADTTAGASPTALGRCGLGGTLSVWTGAEVAPWLSVGGEVLAAEGQLGLELARSTWTAGAFASIAALGPGAGVRFGWPAGSLGGPEVRFGWQAPVGARASVAWVKTFGWRSS